MEARLIIEEDLAILLGKTVEREISVGLEFSVVAEEELIVGMEIAEFLDRSLDHLDGGGSVAVELKAVAIFCRVDDEFPSRDEIMANLRGSHDTLTENVSPNHRFCSRERRNFKGKDNGFRTASSGMSP